MSNQWNDIKHIAQANRVSKLKRFSHLSYRMRHFVRVMKTIDMFYPDLLVTPKIINLLKKAKFWSIVQPFRVDALILERFCLFPSEIIYYHIQRHSGFIQQSSGLHEKMCHQISKLHTSEKNLVIADMGAGVGSIQLHVQQKYTRWYVHSVDYIKSAPHILCMNMKKTCIIRKSCNVVVFINSLWGITSDLEDYLREAHRILVESGFVIIYDSLERIMEIKNLRNINHRYSIISETTTDNVNCIVLRRENFNLSSDSLRISSIQSSPSISYEFLND